MEDISHLLCIIKDFTYSGKPLGIFHVIVRKRVKLEVFQFVCFTENYNL